MTECEACRCRHLRTPAPVSRGTAVPLSPRQKKVFTQTSAYAWKYQPAQHPSLRQPPEGSDTAWCMTLGGASCTTLALRPHLLHGQEAKLRTRAQAWRSARPQHRPQAAAPPSRLHCCHGKQRISTALDVQICHHMFYCMASLVSYPCQQQNAVISPIYTKENPIAPLRRHVKVFFAGPVSCIFLFFARNTFFFAKIISTKKKFFNGKGFCWRRTLFFTAERILAPVLEACKVKG